jgi:hypothetical protein
VGSAQRETRREERRICASGSVNDPPPPAPPRIILTSLQAVGAPTIRADGKVEGGAVPLPRCAHVTVYDAEQARILMWVGWVGRDAQPSQPTVKGEVWAYSLIGRSWTVVAAADAPNCPATRTGTAGAFFRGYLMVFGGFRQDVDVLPGWTPHCNEVLLYNCSENTWVQGDGHRPDGVLSIEGVAPAPRDKHTAVIYNDALIVFGGWGLRPMPDDPWFCARGSGVATMEMKRLDDRFDPQPIPAAYAHLPREVLEREFREGWWVVVCLPYSPWSAVFEGGMEPEAHTSEWDGHYYSAVCSSASSTPASSGYVILPLRSFHGVVAPGLVVCLCSGSKPLTAGRRDGSIQSPPVTRRLPLPRVRPIR